MTHGFRLVLTVLGAFALTGTAQAHGKLITSKPAANATVAKPTSITLTFSEKVAAAFSGADVVMTGMPGMADHKPTKLTGLKQTWSSDGKTLTLAAGRPFPTGTYEVNWRAAGSDTHLNKGSFSFAVK